MLQLVGQGQKVMAFGSQHEFDPWTMLQLTVVLPMLSGLSATFSVLSVLLGQPVGCHNAKQQIWPQPNMDQPDHEHCGLPV